MYPPESDSKCELSHEVRFAVVLYGGVSLAVYIHGVTRELYHLVRSTAPRRDDQQKPHVADDQLEGTEVVYRKVGRLLDSDRIRFDEWEIRENEVVPLESNSTPIRARFVVDILSGSSAGGINAVFLAKALATATRLRGLADLWMNEANLRNLINDSGTRDRRMPRIFRQRPPAALLSGRWMYVKLLEALHGMEQGRSVGDGTPYVEELDLYVTTTDLQGLVLPIRLSDGDVFEPKHNHVFHLGYASTARELALVRNDFGWENNPFLAFIARCTSSFPLAFEPMTLGEIEPLVHEVDPEYPVDREEWAYFFERYPAKYRLRAFADGGYLDNKPFSYITRALERRRASIPVQRKVLYVEPNPETFDDVDRLNRDVQPKPDAFENLLAAGFVLPRQETIREDLERVLERNRTIHNIREVIAEASDAASRARRERDSDFENMWLNQKGEDWKDKDMREMVAFYGAPFAAYRELRIRDTIDQLADLAAFQIGVERESDAGLLLEEVLRQWKNENYVRYRVEDPSRPLENEFLYDYDLNWRLRRLSFFRRQIDLVYSADRHGQELLPISTPNQSDPHRLRPALEEIRLAVDELYGDVLSRRAALYSPKLHLAQAPELAGFWEVARRLGELRRPLLEMVLRGAQDRRAAAKELKLDSVIGALIDQYTQALKHYLAPTISMASRNGRVLVPVGRETGLNSSEFVQDADLSGAIPAVVRAVEFLDTIEKNSRQAALQFCRFYYRGFEYYDMISLPFLTGSDAGEAVLVDVLRVSPQDAFTMSRAMGLQPESKLAGTALANFGGFLVEDWRRNDLLWGRLDGAERLIMALIPDALLEDDQAKEIRGKLIEEAQLAILEEEVIPKDRRKIAELLSEALDKSTSDVNKRTDPKDSRDEISELVSRLGPDRARLESVLRGCVEREHVREFFMNTHRVDPVFPPAPTMQILSRSTRVIGLLMDGIARGADDMRRVYQRPGVWIAKVGQVLWGLALLAVPGSFWNLLAHHFIKILYAFEIVLIMGGIVLSAEMARFGILALAMTAAAHMAIAWTERYLQGRGLRLNLLLRTALGVAGLGVAGLAIWKAGELIGVLGDGPFGAKIFEQAHAITTWIGDRTRGFHF